MSSAKYEITNEAVLAWCKDLHEKGYELAMSWSGGNDSGYVEFILDKPYKTDQDLDYIEYLENECYDQLDYGSWAGEFSAEGTATFDPIENAFIGTDYYYEDSSETVGCKLRLAVPKNVWFDRLEIHIGDHDIRVTSELIVTNGFKTLDHEIAQDNLNDYVHDQVNDIIADIDNYRSMWVEISVNYDEFTPEGDEMVHYLTSLEVGTEDGDEKSIYISLDTE